MGIAAAGAMFGGWNWGSGGIGKLREHQCQPGGRISTATIIAPASATGGRWQHDATHRRGVAYRDPATRQQFGQSRPGRRPAPTVHGQTGRAGRPGAGAGGPGWSRERVFRWRRWRRWPRWLPVERVPRWCWWLLVVRVVSGRSQVAPAVLVGRAGNVRRPGSGGGPGGNPNGLSGCEPWPTGKPRRASGQAQQQRSAPQLRRRRRWREGGWWWRRRWRRGGGVVAVAVAVKAGDEQPYPWCVPWRWSVHLACQRRRWRKRLHLNCVALPPPEAAADALIDGDPQQRRQGVDRHPGLDVTRVRASAAIGTTTKSAPQFLKARDEKHAIMPEGADKALFGAGHRWLGRTDPRSSSRAMNGASTSRPAGRRCRGAPDRPQSSAVGANAAGDCRCPARLCRP